MWSTQSISRWLSGDEFTVIISATLSVKKWWGEWEIQECLSRIHLLGYEKTVSEHGTGISSFKFTIFIQKILTGVSHLNFFILTSSAGLFRCFLCWHLHVPFKTLFVLKSFAGIHLTWQIRVTFKVHQPLTTFETEGIDEMLA